MHLEKLPTTWGKKLTKKHKKYINKFCHYEISQKEL